MSTDAMSLSSHWVGVGGGMVGEFIWSPSWVSCCVRPLVGGRGMSWEGWVVAAAAGYEGVQC